jgi:hypothetical protein
VDFYVKITSKITIDVNKKCKIFKCGAEGEKSNNTLNVGMNYVIVVQN